MTTDLRETYELFDRYLSRMNADVEMAIQHLPETERAEFRVPRLDFAEFCAFWASVSANPAMRQRWGERLAPGGYEAEQEAIERALDRCSRDRAANNVSCEPEGRKAA